MIETRRLKNFVIFIQKTLDISLTYALRMLQGKFHVFQDK